MSCSWTQNGQRSTLQLFTDASGSLGFGAYFNGAWFRGDWQPHQCLPLRSIQWQELFAIMAAASTWGYHWSGLRIHIHCDNLPIVQAWARQSAKHPDLMQLLRTLFLVAAQHSFTICLSPLPGRLNSIADPLSRNNLPLFLHSCPPGRLLIDTNPTSPHRDLNHRLQLLQTRSLAPPTTTLYATGVRHYQGFCHAFKLVPVPGTKETITLFAAHLSQSMNPRTIQLYVAAVSFLHHSLGYRALLPGTQC